MSLCHIAHIQHLSWCLAAAFDEVPVTQEVATGAQAVFRCRHPTADIVRWRVNGSLVGRNPPPDITPDTTRDDSGNLVHLLTITARPEYSGTEVVCVARFDDSRPEELSQPAILTGTDSNCFLVVTDNSESTS